MANRIGTFDEYFQSVITSMLPASALEAYNLNKIGLYIVTPKNAIRKAFEENKTSAAHEKSAPDVYLLRKLNEDNKYSPTYIKPFVGQAMGPKLTKIIVNSALQFYPNPLNSYGVMQEVNSYNRMGIATVDLNHLQNEQTGKHAESKRLDVILKGLGLKPEIDCFMDFQNLLQNKVFVKAFSPRAIVQIGLATIFIPNAIGELDANCRGVVMLKSENGEQYDTGVRIDADANVFLSNIEDNGHVDTDSIPKGIYGPEEQRDVFLKNIASKSSDVDWNLFMGFTLLAQAATSRTRIDQAVSNAYMINSGNAMQNSYFGLKPSPYERFYNADAFFDFSSFVINHAKEFSEEVLDAMGGALPMPVPPFVEPNSKYPDVVVESNTTPVKLVQEDVTIQTQVQGAYPEQ